MSYRAPFWSISFALSSSVTQGQTTGSDNSQKNPNSPLQIHGGLRYYNLDALYATTRGGLFDNSDREREVSLVFVGRGRCVRDEQERLLG